ncbi:FAD-dependent oxidoreductase [Maritimibacter sp. 55A14]|uniref:FAD-dependent oxidoreductase n=1 Tax=Maritimibacter sp. 55A14 TaxID=2174844 RepID=UPI000D610712|nr:FAD-dependent oxidoreductase [Maritimibacter sp. 55A14]PWE32813.1 FAD-dependent oxidoreductase [Maritimibacter sp. 55A14]
MSEAITIRGAGIVGLCVATELMARGVSVTLRDPAAAPGAHGCSWWAGGMLAPYCEGFAAEEPVVRLGKEAADWWEAQGVPVERKGSLVVTLQRDRRELDQFARRTNAHRMVTGADLAELEPFLADRHDRALYFEDEAHIDPRAALVHLQQRLQEAGARFEQSDAAPDGAVIDCRGLAAQDTLPELRGVKGEMVVLRAPDVTLNRPVRLLHPRFPLYIVPRGDGVFMLGATQIESEERWRASVRSVMELLSAAFALHPAFGEAEVMEIGADARPAFPDNLPRITRKGDTLHVNGLFRHGFLLSPAVAKMTAGLVMRENQRPEFYHEDHG